MNKLVEVPLQSIGSIIGIVILIAVGIAEDREARTKKMNPGDSLITPGDEYGKTQKKKAL